MNKNKISPELLNRVSVMDKNKTDSIFVSSYDFWKTKKFLDKYKYSYIPYKFANCFSLNLDYDDISILSTLPDVEYLHSNPLVKIQRAQVESINLHRLTENKFLGQGQTICFIDTGIYPHFDFLYPKNRIIKFIDLINHHKQPYDDNGHGTFVAGIASGMGIIDHSNIGFAPRANIISIKALGRQGNSNSNVILDAMQWIYENHKVYNITVVCMSFGAEDIENNDPLSQGAQALWKRGITVVAAAGNSGPKNRTIKSPGNNPYIITVGALDESSMKTADFSSRGPTIYGHKPDLLAPAVNIISCDNKLPLYTNMSGTSVATPIVAGICADIKSRWHKITNNEIKKFLLSHCKKITGDIDSEGAGYLTFNI